MKKLLALATAFILTFTLIGCSSSSSSNKGGIEVESLDPNKPVTVKIGATNVPHAELLEYIAPKLEKEGIKLDIVTYQDYYLPNKNLAEKEIDLNYFQHVPFLNNSIKENGYKIEDAGSVHIEPIGLYSKKVKNLSDLSDGATVLVSNNKAEWGRVLKLLQDNGLVKVKDGVDIITATFDDVAENPKNLKFNYENDPAIMVQYYNNNEGDLISINSNFAVDAKISPVNDSVVVESADNNPYANILVVREGDKNKVVTKKILEYLQSEDTKNYIREKYKGAVIPA
ncbi:MetQ/NlpA family ABC transporter substrate-binding protein [Gemella sp. GH3]|uniref:MetQ/NlpA family ABC transporter substrate-binding protein n=1 Tax=unclassified Gemella TaxID=2624949 RepID=UPI0015CF88AE|nr:MULTISPECIES: MetQ/NlpA family ABC transporter substrate-binding protein [unclassified Gemella]MBF0713747.1 MetQ/NlpA family ABC transporter substrate-binding protein [Gemella sp. GH3.1]NYS50699.1 MetQ/NlpA family ABC transporter substrate-binding protein [Gemella sp. GH3]